jgi:hypothetical protein
VNSLLTGLRACIWNGREWVTGANPARAATTGGTYLPREVVVPVSRGEIGTKQVQADSPVLAYPNNAGVHDILGDITIFWRGSLDSFASNGVTFLSKTTGNGATATPYFFGANASGKPLLGRAHATDFRNWTTSSITTPTARAFSLAVAVGGGQEINTAPTFYQDTIASAETPGVSSGGTGSGAPTLSANGLRFGNRSATDNNQRTDGHTILVYAWARKLTPSELGALFADPYLVRDQVLPPARPLVVDGPAAVAAATIVHAQRLATLKRRGINTAARR